MPPSQLRKTKKRTPRLTKNSKAIKLLTRRLQSGQLTGKESVVAVWNSEDVFRQHRFPTFRTRYLRLLKELGISRDVNDEEEDANTLNRSVTGVRDTHLSGRNKNSEISGSGSSGNAAFYSTPSDLDDGAEMLFSEKFFMPFRLLSEWNEPQTTTKRCTVVVHLPSGVTHEDFTIHIVGEGNYLELNVKWPNPLTDLTIMHAEWLKTSLEGQYTTFHPEFLGFERALKELRSHSSEEVVSKARFHLPFVVERTFETYNLMYHGGTKLVYIRLKAHTDSYESFGRSFKAFEVVECS